MRLRFVIIAILCGTIAYIGYWHYVASNAPEHITAQIAKLQEQRTTITYDQMETTGFPYRLIFAFDNPVVNMAGKGGALGWSSQRIELFAQPWNLSHIIMSSGPSEFTSEAKAIQAGTMRTSAVLSDGVPTRVSIELNDALIKHRNGGAMISADTLGLHVRSKSISTPLKADSGDRGLLLPAVADLALGAREMAFGGKNAAELEAIKEVTLLATLHGHKIPRYDADALAEWRDTGGTIEVSSLNIQLSGFQIEASGSFSLDKDFRPIGALSARVPEMESVYKLLGAFIYLNPESQTLLSAALNLLKTFSPDGTIPLSITAQDGILWLGPLELMELAPIINPGPSSPN